MDQNEQRSKRNGGVRPENSGKSTQTVKHVKLDLERPKLTRATPIRAVSVRALVSAPSTPRKKTAEPR